MTLALFVLIQYQSVTDRRINTPAVAIAWYATAGRPKQESLADARVTRDSSACMKAPREEI